MMIFSHWIIYHEFLLEPTPRFSPCGNSQEPGSFRAPRRGFPQGVHGAKKKVVLDQCLINVCWIILSGFYGCLMVLYMMVLKECWLFFVLMLFPCFSVLFFMFVECFMDSWISSLASYLDTIKRPHLVVMESIEIVDLAFLTVIFEFANSSLPEWLVKLVKLVNELITLWVQKLCVLWHCDTTSGSQKKSHRLESTLVAWWNGMRIWRSPGSVGYSIGSG